MLAGAGARLACATKPKIEQEEGNENAQKMWSECLIGWEVERKDMGEQK